MERVIILLLCLFCFGVFRAYSQTNYQEIDQKSFQWYQDENWQALASLGDSINHEIYDYYYLNFRFGIANYNLGKYQKALYFFNKAYRNNSASEVLKEYLFWTNQYLGNTYEADEYYAQLSDKKQLEINNILRKPFDYFYLESGEKIVNRSSEGFDIFYFNGGINHQFSRKFSLYHAYTYLKNSLPWSQYEYYFSPNYVFGKNSIQINFHGALATTGVDYSEDYLYQSNNPTPDDGYNNDTTIVYSYSEKGEIKTKGLFSEISFSHRFGNLQFTPHVGYYREFTQPNYIRTRFDSSSISYQFNDQEYANVGSAISQILDNPTPSDSYLYQGGISGTYRIKNIAFSLDYSLIRTDDNELKHYFIPRLDCSYNKMKLKLSYLYKDNHAMSFEEGSLLYNHNFPMQIYHATWSRSIFKNNELFLTYQKEKLSITTDNIQNKNTVLLGLKIKL